MTIALDENILIAFMTVVFIPIIVFFIKLIIDLGIIKERIQSLCEKITRIEKELDRIDVLENKVNIHDIRIERLEKDDRRSAV